MTFRKNDTIVFEVTVIVWVELESFWMEEEDSNEVRDGSWGSGVSWLGDSDSLCWVDFDLIADILPESVVLIDFNFFIASPGIVGSASFGHLVKRYEIFIEFIDEVHWFISYENYFFIWRSIHHNKYINHSTSTNPSHLLSHNHPKIYDL